MRNHFIAHDIQSQFTHVFAVDLDDHVVELEAGRLPDASRAYLSVTCMTISRRDRLFVLCWHLNSSCTTCTVQYYTRAYMQYLCQYKLFFPNVALSFTFMMFL